MKKDSKKTYEAIISLAEIMKKANGNANVFQMNPAVYDNLEEYAKLNKIPEDEMKKLDRINIREDNFKKVNNLIKKAKNPKKVGKYFNKEISYENNLKIDKAIIYSEVFEILKNIDKNFVRKIPRKIIIYIKENKSPLYKNKFNWNIPLENQGIHEDTVNILAWINENFWENENKSLVKFNHHFKFLNKILEFLKM